MRYVFFSLMAVLSGFLMGKLKYEPDYNHLLYGEVYDDMDQSAIGDWSKMGLVYLNKNGLLTVTGWGIGSSGKYLYPDSIDDYCKEIKSRLDKSQTNK